jgi:glycosyltransferase involved in cell wall biosynthesis
MLFNYDYYNIYYYDEINIVYNFLQDLNIHKIFINSLVGFSNIIYDMIIKLSQNFSVNTYLHDYYFLFNDAQIYFNNLPENPSNDLWSNYKINILQISNKIMCPSYYTKYLYNRYINNNNINIDVIFHKEFNKSNFNNVINITNKQKYKILIYGEISETKGKKIIQKLINECLDFEFVIYGICDFDSTINCKVNGVYKDIELPNIINNENPDVIFFSSIFCETFCYALIPALESIYPIICPNYGSFIELTYGRKNTYHINPYDLNKNKFIEILNKFNSNYYNLENDLGFLKINEKINYLTLDKLI